MEPFTICKFNDEIHLQGMKIRNNSLKKTYKMSDEVMGNGITEKPVKKNNKPDLFINMNALDEKDILYKQKKDTIYTNKNNNDSNNELIKTSNFIQDRLYLLSSVIGDTKPKQNHIKGYVGLITWTLNIIIHFSFDFYESTFLFHVSWATSIGIYLLMFIICTIFIIKHTVRWYAKAIKKLAKEKIYESTLQKLHFIFKVVPFVMMMCSVSGAAAQYGCYAYDNALKVDFNSDKNGTRTVPEFIEIVANILRFTSLSHIYYTMFLILILNAIVFFTVVHSQKRFNDAIGQELKSHPPSMTFQEAVNKFAARTKLLRGASENTTVVLTTLLLTTSISFVVNAYNFLFIKNFAIYVWFAIAPLLWTVAPLIGGALVTSSFQQLKLIVIQSWVEIPEKYDELWNRAQNEPIKKLPNPDWKKFLNNMRAKKLKKDPSPKKESIVTLRKPRSESDLTHVRPRKGSYLTNFFTYRKRKNAVAISKPVVEIDDTCSRTESKSLPSKLSTIGFSDTQSESNHHESIVKSNSVKSDGFLTVSDIGSPVYYSSSTKSSSTDQIIDEIPKTFQSTLSESDLSNPVSPIEDSDNIGADRMINKTEQIISDSHSCILNVDVTNSPAVSGAESDYDCSESKKKYAQDVPPVITVSPADANANKHTTKMAKVVSVAQNIEKLRKARRKFNYEKYIKFLELTLDTIGFSLGKVAITWDRASFFMVLLLTLVGVFAQNAFLK